MTESFRSKELYAADLCTFVAKLTYTSCTFGYMTLLLYYVVSSPRISLLNQICSCGQQDMLANGIQMHVFPVDI